MATRTPEYSVKVNGLPMTADKREIQEMLDMAGFASVSDIWIPDKFLRKGFGFFRFSDPEEAERCVQSEFDVQGCQVMCERAMSEKKGSGGMGGGKGGIYGGGVAGGATFGAAGESYPDYGQGGYGVGNGGGMADCATFGGAGEGTPEYGQGWRQGGVAGGTTFGGAGEGTPEYGQGGRGDMYGGGMAGGATFGGAGENTSEYGQGDLSASAPAETSIFVGNLPPGITSSELTEAFEHNNVRDMTDVYVPPRKSFGFVRFATYSEAELALELCRGLQFDGCEAELSISTSVKRSAFGGIDSPQAFGPMGGFRGNGGMGACGGRFDNGLDDMDGGCGGRGFGGSQRMSDRGRDRGGQAAEVSIKVGNLSRGTTSRELKREFESHGLQGTTDVYVPTGKNFGFLRFGKLSDAHAAMALDGICIGGKAVELDLAVGDKRSMLDGPLYGGFNAGFNLDSNNEVSIKVSNLPPGVTQQELAEVFVSHGIDSMTDCYIPPGKKFGFLRFATAAEGKFALQSKVLLHGREIELEPSTRTKRGAEVMCGNVASAPYFGHDVVRPTKVARTSAGRTSARTGPARTGLARAGPNGSNDPPSLKASSLPKGATAEDLRNAMVNAGCVGNITDVYVPRGERQYGFVRFATQEEAEDAAFLSPCIDGEEISLELAISQRKG